MSESDDTGVVSGIDMETKGMELFSQSFENMDDNMVDNLMILLTRYVYAPSQPPLLGILSLHKKVAIHQVTTMLVTSKNTAFGITHNVPP